MSMIRMDTQTSFIPTREYHSPSKKEKEKKGGGEGRIHATWLKSPKHCFMEKKSDTKEYILYYFIFVKFRNRQINLQ